MALLVIVIFVGGERMGRSIPDTISQEDLQLLVKSAKKNKLKSALILMFFQCLRVSELTNLNKSNIDFRRGFIHIKQGKGRRIEIAQFKSLQSIG